MRHQKFSAAILKNSTKIGVCNVSSHFALNLNGTGFSSSKSSPTESPKLILSNSFLKTPIFKGKVDLHFVRALCEISAAGEVLAPGLMATPETEHSDCVQCSYSPNARIGPTPKAFMHRQIVTGHRLTAILPYMAKFRKSISPNASALIRFDSYISQLSDQSNAWAVQHQAILDNILAQSSYVRHPLDQGFLRRLKIQHGLFTPGNDICKISGALQWI